MAFSAAVSLEQGIPQLEAVLKQYFGHDGFRPGQREIVEQVLQGQDQLILMPTGGGKSLTYQLPALLLPGLTIVVSPLIALMQDQVERLQDNGIAATYVNSSLTPGQRTQREQAALQGRIKLLYVAPERLLSESFLPLLDQIQARVGLSLLAIDEAHCVSEWGHDFRPEYRQLARVRERYPGLPALALTATATERVRQDILSQLRLEDPHVHIASFNRPNLYYEVRAKHKDSYAELVHLLRQQPDAAVIIYCQSRKSVEFLSERLNRDGISALPYHAGLSGEQRAEHQSRFIRDDVPVLVATVAFGMGIGKPDVRAVIHYELPRNLEGYYQESGRAGRDSQTAQCILFFSPGDRAKVEYLITQKPDEQEQRIARQQLNQVMAYAESTTCRRRIQLSYFGETLQIGNCKNCDNCLRPLPLEDRTIHAQKFLSCVARCRERFGMRHIIDVLRGANTQQIRRHGHEKLSTYGIGQDQTVEEWQRLGRALLHQNLLEEATDGYSILKLNEGSWQVLRQQLQVQVAIPISAATPRLEESGPVQALDVDSEGLFQHLRALRKRLADDLGVPPYGVFPDTSLRAMAQQRPDSQTQFAQIPGVGTRKLEAYSAVFTQAIRAYCEAYDLPLGLMPELGRALGSGPIIGSTNTVASSPSLTQKLTLELYQQGLSLEEIAQQRQLKARTIADHLASLIEAGEISDLERLVSPDRHEVILATFKKLGSEALTPVRECLGEQYTYDEIRFVRALHHRSS
ncbi:DNA helicase RecQ [Leptolyngbya sp. FACHB-261]|uniref:DNA helicase RecQ n=1 Tax=Leptolyngbya sp. FACHB-261 TaxID=2692806 RepID=UPI00168674E2|nr:DNA helicase RecQ [Leptolyngbya sp. FACHB-261]MBD2103694.1 DNA helicase RecQ [Leptolyngbya sp. FACHB-261]